MPILENLMIFDAGGEEHPHMTSLRIDQDMLLTELEQDSEVRRQKHKCEAIKAINSFRAWGESQLDEAQAKYCN